MSDRQIAPDLTRSMSATTSRAGQADTVGGIASLQPDVCMRALGARDARFDGLFFVGITTTRIYCRPVCPARASTPARRRFFESAASAERAGFRPCLRCRPELAPGRALIDAVPRLARAAAHRIEAGALNGRGVGDLARELGVSERHLRRVLEREIGVSPIELAQTHRLLLAKRLLADTALSVTRIAFASGFQSLRRFNYAFREHYRMSPSDLRRSRHATAALRETGSRQNSTAGTPTELVRLTLAYRTPIAWDALISVLRREALPEVEVAERGRYRRTLRVDGRTGVVFAEDAAANAGDGRRTSKTHLNVDVSPSLLPVLMPLLSGLRRLFDLDAEPSAVDSHLAHAGLGALVRQTPGVRVPGAMDGFEVVLRTLLGGRRSRAEGENLVRRVVDAFGDAFDTGYPGLVRLAPTAERVAAATPRDLMEIGVAPRCAEMLIAVARALVSGALYLEPGSDIEATRRTLMRLARLSDRLATTIVMRALYWPDALVADRELQRAAGVASRCALRAVAERWRPWRAYAALRLRLQTMTPSSAAGLD
ncbi:MAG: DNA-3-methyladenine glycosylase 2 family protein [Gemmatimonadaceae bacterium]